jgi:hypothetical protein
MPNSIKYSTTGDTRSLRGGPNGRFYFGVGDVGKGPSSATTYYNTVVPPTTGYTVYSYDATQVSNTSYETCSNDSELITLTNLKSGQSFTGVSQCLAWYLTQSNYACVNRDYPTIPTSGLTFISDVGATISYPLSGSSSYSMDAAGAGGSVSYNSGTVYTSEYGGGFQFNGSSGQATCSLPLSTVPFTFVMIARSVTSTWTSGGGLGYGTGFDTSFQIFPINGSKIVFFYVGSNGFNQTFLGQIEPSSITIPHMYVVSSNGTNLHKGYVDNGAPVSNTTNISRTASSNAYTSWGGGFGWLNMVSYVQLYYNRQLSDAEVLSLYNGYRSRFYLGFDADALAFIFAAGITNTTQQTAINQLVVDLKSYSLWDKMKALYPFVGGTATSHKFNLKDPRDLDAAYRLQFYGGWTHNSNGIQGGSGAYANTFAAAGSTAIPDRANHWSSYNIELPTSTGSAGFYDYPPNITSFGWSRASTNNWFGGLQNFSQTGAVCQRGFINGTVTSSSNSVLYQNGSAVFTTAGATSFGSTYEYYLGTFNLQGSPSSDYNNALVAFTSLGGSLTPTNAANFYTAVQAFQTTLGRQV